MLLRNETYYFLKRVPYDLKDYYSVKRLCFSLKTKSYSSALRMTKSVLQRKAKAHELVKLYSNEALSPKQLDTLIKYIQAQVDKHLKLDRVEASIIDTDDKSVVFMWSKIKRRYVTNDTFVWTNEIAAKEAHCSKSNVKAIMRKLEKLGAITCIQKGKSGSFTRRANLYRREV